MRRALLLGAAVLALGASDEHAGHAGAPRFEAPAAGSYELPPITRVAEHELLDETGKLAPVLAWKPGEASLVSFVYLSCPDSCPTATATFAALDRLLAERPALARRVQLVTVSFDPARDTPERMAALQRALAPRGRWRFVTAASREAIQPVLDDFGQDAAPLSGDAAERIAHVLKVFLVDGEGRVRNVYSTGFLDVRLLLADLETVLGGVSLPTLESPVLGPFLAAVPCVVERRDVVGLDISRVQSAGQCLAAEPQLRSMATDLGVVTVFPVLAKPLLQRKARRAASILGLER